MYHQSMFTESRHRGAAGVALLLTTLLAACAQPLPTTPSPAATPSTAPSSAITEMAATALALGSQVEIEGVLQSEGNPPGLRFYVLSDQGARMQVLPWLPVEVIQPPDGQTAPETMAAWVGQRVQLKGTMVQSDMGVALQVTRAVRVLP